MKNQYIYIAVVVLCSIVSINCATILKGYEDSVILTNAPDSIRVITHEGAELQVVDKIIRVPSFPGSNKYVDAPPVKFVSLRTNREHTLHLKYQDKEKVVTVYPKIVFWWGIIDVLCGGFPIIIDIYTGSWNQFSEVEAGF